MSAVPAPDVIPPAEALGRVHFVGIGGAGMSGIARILLSRGLQVSGSDAKDSRVLAALRALGARVEVGHEAGHVGAADTVVVSSAISERNPELVEARRRNLLVLPRAAALASVMVGRKAIAVAGTHGKTTTTSLLTVALQHCGLDPSFAIGGNLNESGANAHNGSGEFFVAEADESDGSFLLYSPLVAVVTNVEPDHLDHYGTAEAVAEAFEAFTGRVTEGGFIVACADDPGAAALAARARADGRDVRTYGEAEDADVRLRDLRQHGFGYAFRAESAGSTGSAGTEVAGTSDLGPFSLRIPGRHNALNAAAALTVGLGLGLPVEDLREGLDTFSGTRRRSELKGVARGVRVYDDYAHHPTEVRAVLTAFRPLVPGGRLVVAFQPHRYTRTAAFAEQFGRALGLADEVVVMEVYSAGERPIPGAGGAAVAAAVPLPEGQVRFEPSWSAVAGRLAERARPGDIVLTLGAGDITMIGPQLLSLLAEETSDAPAGTVGDAPAGTLAGEVGGTVGDEIGGQ